jgi:hypothetical protein
VPRQAGSSRLCSSQWASSFESPEDSSREVSRGARRLRTSSRSRAGPRRVASAGRGGRPSCGCTEWGRGRRPWPPTSGGYGCRSPACSPAWHTARHRSGDGTPDMNRAAGRGRVLRPAARSLRANASVRRPGRSHGRCLGSPPSWVRGRAGSPGWRAGGERLQLQFVWELPRRPADSHHLEPDSYVDHRMISTCIRFDSNRVVPYSPSRYPHGMQQRASPRAQQQRETSL